MINMFWCCSRGNCWYMWNACSVYPSLNLSTVWGFGGLLIIKQRNWMNIVCRSTQNTGIWKTDGIDSVFLFPLVILCMQWLVQYMTCWSGYLHFIWHQLTVVFRLETWAFCNLRERAWSCCRDSMIYQHCIIPSPSWHLSPLLQRL